MREIKFRAWDKKEKKMLLPQYQNYWLQIGLEGIIYEFSNGRLLDTTIKPVKYSTREYPYELMQYTGLKDKNGKEIFEGDIVLISEDENKKAANTPHEDHFLFGDKAQIFFDECNANFVLLDNESGEETSIGYYAGWSNWNWLTVIGNIYENPELLDVKK